MGTVYTQLSYQERRRIEGWWLAKVSVAEMARVLKRHKSTIFREIKRNFWADDSLPKKYAGYFGMAAHQRTLQRRSTQRKLIRHPELCKSIVSRLKNGWTPEQIGNRMIHEGDKLRMRPDRIIVGELRWDEALAFLEAINTGNGGSVSTIHAETAELAIDRLAIVILQAGTPLTFAEGQNYILKSIDVIVQLGRKDGKRGISKFYVPS